LLFTNNERLYRTANVATITATIWQAGNKSNPIEAYGPVGVYVEEMLNQGRSYVEARKLYGQNAPTHDLYLDYQESALKIPDYRPKLGADYLHVTGSRGGYLDGYYSLVEYAGFKLFYKDKLDHLPMKCRYLGITKSGDTGEDNSGNLRIGGTK
jgi:hypothetical protein